MGVESVSSFSLRAVHYREIALHSVDNGYNDDDYDERSRRVNILSRTCLFLWCKYILCASK
jgi:hypothetical protein